MLTELMQNDRINIEKFKLTLMQNDQINIE